ncbi:CRE-ACIN-1 protein [Caenorhabditis remanei]|uniref:CRE-ACIN-1 protein n=1 Tax=Caenorhabditis remanei TaxID=31234 RepID=E3MGI2_CAERE|nr:CRE-ACIN-1 protein [Caenorhabditis remanei]
MSDDDIMIDGRPLSSLKVAELKEELEKRQISIKGVKAVLQDKLREVIASQGDTNVETLGLEPKRQRTDSDASGTNVSQNDSSPTKKSDLSPTKRQTPRRSQKTSQSSADNEPVEAEPEKELHQKIDTETAESNTGTEEDNGPSGKPEASDLPAVEDSRTIIENNGEVNVPAVEQNETAAGDSVAPVTIKTVEAQAMNSESSNEKVEKEEATTDEVADEKEEPKKGKKDEDDDELDYGDDEEKEQNEDSMDAEDVKEEKEKVIQIDRNQGKKDDGVKKEDKVRGSVSHRRVSSPSSRHPVSNIVHIRGLTRPFTERQLRNEIERHGGEIVDFWIDKVKSHCFAQLNTDADAGKVLDAMHDIVWPDGNPKKLAIVFDTEDNMIKYKEGRESTIIEPATIGGRADRLSTTSQTSMLGGKASLQITLQNVIRDNDKLDSERKEKRGTLASRLTRVDDKDKGKEERKRKRSETPPFSRGAGFMDEKKPKHDEIDRGTRRDESSRRVVEEEVPKKSLDQCFKKTAALPPIYYLPLTDEQVAEKNNKKKTNEPEKAPERVERPEIDRNRGERSDHGDRAARVDRGGDRGDRGDRNDRGDRGDRGDRPRRRD